ncbi:hypothetical protein BKA67DRAFT_236126 [Truncatella angustata]|uniref:Uncharacterized protein n=1 Tax=Truncatella angustata TaxID=152316 RepID=A0A9P8UNF2_9PEZI|nr:uncharacterized protein BKA67DRAFT_236126 [Truncatella angustata]KAH6655413.1 hypothetical protein BKA67DRAFT_236126 [Truncatella angustata]
MADNSRVLHLIYTSRVIVSRSIHETGFHHESLLRPLSEAVHICATTCASQWWQSRGRRVQHQNVLRELAQRGDSNYTSRRQCSSSSPSSFSDSHTESRAHRILLTCGTSSTPITETLQTATGLARLLWVFPGWITTATASEVRNPDHAGLHVDSNISADASKSVGRMTHITAGVVNIRAPFERRSGLAGSTSDRSTQYDEMIDN